MSLSSPVHTELRQDSRMELKQASTNLVRFKIIGHLASHNYSTVMRIHQTFNKIIAFVLCCTCKYTDNVTKLSDRLIFKPHILLCRNYMDLGCN